MLAGVVIIFPARHPYDVLPSFHPSRAPLRFLTSREPFNVSSSSLLPRRVARGSTGVAAPAAGSARPTAPSGRKEISEIKRTDTAARFWGSGAGSPHRSRKTALFTINYLHDAQRLARQTRVEPIGSATLEFSAASPSGALIQRDSNRSFNFAPSEH